MSRYLPPHLRNGQGSVDPAAQSSRGAVQTTAKPSSGMQSRWAPSVAAGPSTLARPAIARDSVGWQSFRRLDQSSTQVLASPASDLKPRKATKEWSRPSQMEMLASVSRSGGDGQEGDALKDHATQHAFRQYIDERLDQHYSRFESDRAAPPSTEHKEELESMKSIVLLFRKLREGITAAHRIDAFAIEVYESSALLAILAQDTSQLISTLSVLVPGLYKAHDQLSQSSLEGAIGNLKVTSDRRVLCASLFLLYHLCHLDSQSAFWTHHRELTKGDRPFVVAEALVKVTRAAKALSPRLPNPHLFFMTLKDPSLDPHERVMLSWAQERIRERAFAVLRKAYIDAGVDWVFATLGFTEKEGREWVEKQGLRIEGGKVKLRP